ncbi:MAG: hypothetical protein QOG23_2246 [Blastocatellia bacterium]|nr:hypothetical protein [Blastocatellia bacterium]
MNGIHEVRGSIPLGSTKNLRMTWGIHVGCPSCLASQQPDAIRAGELPELSELASRWVQALVRAQA